MLLLFVFNPRRSRSSRTRTSPWRRPTPIRSFSSSSLASSRTASGRSTPIHHASPWSTGQVPLSAARVGGFPGTVRTPVQRQNSVPESPFAYAAHTTNNGGDNEDEDPMQPAQYAVRRDSHRSYDDHHDEEWSDLGRTGGDGRDVEELDFDLVGLDSSTSGSVLLSPPPPGSNSTSPRPPSQFIAAPEEPARTLRARSSRAPVWSYGFVLGGRMRRITIRRPTLESFGDLVELLKGKKSGRYRGNALAATVEDALSVAWAPLLAWYLIISWVL